MAKVGYALMCQQVENPSRLLEKLTVMTGSTSAFGSPGETKGHEHEFIPRTCKLPPLFSKLSSQVRLSSSHHGEVGLIISGTTENPHPTVSEEIRRSKAELVRRSRGTSRQAGNVTSSVVTG